VNQLPDWGHHRAVLFVLDGVLTDTARAHERAWKLTFDEFLADRFGEGFEEFTHDDYLTHVDGRRRYDGVRSFLASRGLALPEGSPADSPAFDSVCAVGNTKNDRFRTVLASGGIEAYPGSLALLDHLDALGIRTAVVSSSASARGVLEAAGLGSRFDVVIDGLEARSRRLHAKPEPDTFLEAARELGVTPSRIVVMDDVAIGVEAARAGGFGFVVGVARDGQAAALTEAGADLVVADLADLIPES
jgi:beta-phosphoglucomutase family hydrolase